MTQRDDDRDDARDDGQDDGCDDAPQDVARDDGGRDEARTYEVGYGKPPVSGQFKKGQSGNPRGRPKGAKGFAACFRREMDSNINVRKGNREVCISKADALILRLFEKAMKGDMSAMRLLISLDRDLSAQVEREAGQQAASSEPDQTDEAILRHFASRIAEGVYGAGVAGDGNRSEDGEAGE